MVVVVGEEAAAAVEDEACAEGGGVTVREVRRRNVEVRMIAVVRRRVCFVFWIFVRIFASIVVDNDLCLEKRRWLLWPFILFGCSLQVGIERAICSDDEHDPDVDISFHLLGIPPYFVMRNGLVLDVGAKAFV